MSCYTKNSHTKPLQVNPIRHSQPMGAALAFMGIHKCLPLMHGAQGCASFTKVFFTRHFNEPIAMYNTSVSDLTAVLDGGDYSILMAIENIIKKNNFTDIELIGLHTTGLTETKGDDVATIAHAIEGNFCYVNTPDFEGGMQEGFALTVQALIGQFTQPQSSIDKGSVVFLVHSSVTPLEVEHIKECAISLGFDSVALPDLSTSLDGELSTAQGKLAQGGITVEQIKNLARREIVVSIGHSMHKSALMLLEKNPKITHYHFDYVSALDGSDALIKALLGHTKQPVPPSMVRWRKRLQDAMLDTHFVLQRARVVITGESDMCVSLAALLNSVGAEIVAVIAATHSEVLHTIDASQVLVGDLEDAKNYFEQANLIISNTHAHRLTHDLAHTRLLLRGFPDFESLGNQLKSDILYEGSTQFLFEAANTVRSAIQIASHK